MESEIQIAQNAALRKRAITDLSNRATKYEVLSHYSTLNDPQCVWPDCDVIDLDMLSLDHVNNDGAKDRKKAGNSGISLYRKLRLAGFPSGYQTLCHNHQWKKQLVLLRTRTGVEQADLNKVFGAPKRYNRSRFDHGFTPWNKGIKWKRKKNRDLTSGGAL